MCGTAAHPICNGFPANEDPQRLTQSLTKKQKQTDQIAAEYTAGELRSGYIVHEADLITRGKCRVVLYRAPMQVCEPLTMQSGTRALGFGLVRVKLSWRSG